MDREPVASSNLRSVGYDDETLEVEFTSGAVYRYLAVPETVYRALMRAKSCGKYFHENIRDKFVADKVT